MHIHPEPFDEVGKLLALKKYEKPPPRYFEDFSGRVIARIEAAEALRAMPWWERLSLAFDLKPALVGAAAVLLSAAVVVGLALSGSDKATEVASQRVNQTPFEMATLAQPGMTMAVVSPNLAVIDRAEEIPASTAPVASATLAATPFSVQRVAWTVGY